LVREKGSLNEVFICGNVLMMDSGIMNYENVVGIAEEKRLGSHKKDEV